jgi:hypothetical protein
MLHKGTKTIGLKVKKGSGSFRLDEGAYDAIVEDIKGQPSKFGDGDCYVWSFKILKPMLEEAPIRGEFRLLGWAHPPITAKNKLGKWAKAAGLDVDDDDDDEVDLEDAIGAGVRITVADDEKEDGSINSKIISVKPLKAKKKTVEDDEDVGERKTKKKKHTEDDEDDGERKTKRKHTEDDEDEGEQKPKKKRDEKKPSKRHDVDDDMIDHQEEEEDEDEEDKPRKRAKEEDKPKKKDKRDDDDDDLFDLDDEDEDDD